VKTICPDNNLRLPQLTMTNGNHSGRRPAGVQDSQCAVQVISGEIKIAVCMSAWCYTVDAQLIAVAQFKYGIHKFVNWMRLPTQKSGVALIAWNVSVFHSYQA